MVLEVALFGVLTYTSTINLCQRKALPHQENVQKNFGNSDFENENFGNFNFEKHNFW